MSFVPSFVPACRQVRCQPHNCPVHGFTKYLPAGRQARRKTLRTQSVTRNVFLKLYSNFRKFKIQ